MTDVLLLPAREPVLVAKQAATLDQISNGRFLLGVGVGSRQDDFTVPGYDFHTRGKRTDVALEVMQRAWRGEPLRGTNQPVTPRPVNGHSVPVTIGGRSDQAVRRAVKYGTGYTMGGGTADALLGMIDRMSTAWTEAGRDGRPEFRALGYFAIGEEVQDEGRSNLMEYYGDYGNSVWQNAAKSAAEAKERVKAFEAAGCDELMLFMSAPGRAQAERLAEAVL
jgi:alkanesulfonate monooxygenase SsuD/methylene tetrahydromethanopterin reductase-like flavin-dependent oxidoreductase (luciferase family)